MRTLNLGRRPYAETQAATRAFTAARTPESEDELWLVEHDPVFTQSVAGRDAHVLAAGNIPVLRTDRGGQVTFGGLSGYATDRFWGDEFGSGCDRDGSAVTRRAEEEQSFDVRDAVRSWTGTVFITERPRSPVTSAVPRHRPLVARPRAGPSNCNVSATVSSAACGDGPQPLQSGHSH